MMRVVVVCLRVLRRLLFLYSFARIVVRSRYRSSLFHAMSCTLSRVLLMLVALEVFSPI